MGRGGRGCCGYTVLAADQCISQNLTLDDRARARALDPGRMTIFLGSAPPSTTFIVQQVDDMAVAGLLNPIFRILPTDPGAFISLHRFRIR